MSAHPAAYWILRRRSSPEVQDEVELPDVPQPGVTGPVPGDILTEYPYSGNDPCKLCGVLLSRYNANVVCFSCVDRAYADGSAVKDRRMRRLLNQRRPRNPNHVSVERSWFDTRLIRRGRSGRVRRTASSRE